MTVFLADDSQVLLRALKSYLSEIAGLLIVGDAGTVQDAIAGVRRLQPDVVILDFAMPGGTGLDVLATIKKADPAPVVIMLTNHANPLIRARCLQAGADAFFDKSTQFQEVTAMLTA
ncbi:MAG: response regulator transcription factor [Acidobacteria bacterium]|nr:response regulator transcription factor [Acidobacteriota bacterium]